MNRLYQAFGLAIASELALPELPIEATDRPADIHIRRGGIPAVPDGAVAHGPYFLAVGASAWFAMPGVGRYHMAGGDELRYEAAPGVADDELRLYLLGSCLAVLLFQRGLLVLHGNAIRVGDRAIVCAGRSGVGKSTLAAAFLARGYPVLADDTSVVDAADRVLPGFPRIKLWQDSADRLSLDTTGLARVRPELEKYPFPLGAGFQTAPLPLSHIYILKPENRADLALAPCAGAARLRPLRGNTYRHGFVDAMGLKAWHLGRIGQLANRVRVARLYRPTARFAPDELVDFILADLADAAATRP